MTACPVLKESIFISKDNLHEAIPSTKERTVGTVATMTCMGGLQLVGASKITCQQNGQWDYSFKPHCTLAPVTEAPTDANDNQKIIIGVTAGVGALLILGIIVMMLAICKKDRKRKRMKQEYEDRIREMDRYPGPPGPDSISDYDGPSTIDRGMYGPRGTGAVLPYGHSRDSKHSQYNSRKSHNGYRSRDDDRRQEYRPETQGYSSERSYDSGRANRMYLPDRDPEYSNSRNKPYVDRWMNKGLSNVDEESYTEVPWVHGRGSRSNHLWRNA